MNKNIQKNKDSLKLCENGFFYKDDFYAYQDIKAIEKVTMLQTDDSYKILMEAVNKDNAYYYTNIIFKVIFMNGKELKIGTIWYAKMYEKHKFTIKEDGLFRFLFNDTYILSAEKARQFFTENEGEFKEYMEELKKLRLDFIDAFNKWKR